MATDIPNNGFLFLKPTPKKSVNGNIISTSINNPKSFFNNTSTDNKFLFLLDNEYEINHDLETTGVIPNSSEEPLNVPIIYWDETGTNATNISTEPINIKIECEQNIKNSERLKRAYKRNHKALIDARITEFLDLPQNEQIKTELKNATTSSEINKLKEKIFTGAISYYEYAKSIDNLKKYYSYLNINRNSNTNYSVKLFMDIVESFASKGSTRGISTQESISKKMCGFRYTKHLLENKFLFIDLIDILMKPKQSYFNQSNEDFNNLFTPILSNRHNLFVDGQNIGYSLVNFNNSELGEDLSDLILDTLIKESIDPALDQDNYLRNVRPLENSNALIHLVESTLHFINFLITYKIRTDLLFDNVVITFHRHNFINFINILITRINVLENTPGNVYYLYNENDGIYINLSDTKKKSIISNFESKILNHIFKFETPFNKSILKTYIIKLETLRTKITSYNSPINIKLYDITKRRSKTVSVYCLLINSNVTYINYGLQTTSSPAPAAAPETTSSPAAAAAAPATTSTLNPKAAAFKPVTKGLNPKATAFKPRVSPPSPPALQIPRIENCTEYGSESDDYILLILLLKYGTCFLTKDYIRWFVSALLKINDEFYIIEPSHLDILNILMIEDNYKLNLKISEIYEMFINKKNINHQVIDYKNAYKKLYTNPRHTKSHRFGYAGPMTYPDQGLGAAPMTYLPPGVAAPMTYLPPGVAAQTLETYQLYNPPGMTYGHQPQGPPYLAQTGRSLTYRPPKPTGGFRNINKRKYTIINNKKNIDSKKKSKKNKELKYYI